MRARIQKESERKIENIKKSQIGTPMILKRLWIKEMYSQLNQPQ